MFLNGLSRLGIGCHCACVSIHVLLSKMDLCVCVCYVCVPQDTMNRQYDKFSSSAYIDYETPTSKTKQ